MNATAQTIFYQLIDNYSVNATRLNKLSQLLEDSIKLLFPKCCVQYFQTRSVRRFHNLNRFGHTSNFTALLSPDPEDRSSYIKGAVAVPIILGVVFALWTLATLVVLPCLGQKRVGFLAGSGFIIRNPSNSCADDSSAGSPSSRSTICKVNLPRPKHIRILCSVSLVILLCSVITLVVLGFNQLKKSAFLIVTSTVVGVQCHFFKVIY